VNKEQIIIANKVVKDLCCQKESIVKSGRKSKQRRERKIEDHPRQDEVHEEGKGGHKTQFTRMNRSLCAVDKRKNSVLTVKSVFSVNQSQPAERVTTNSFHLSSPINKKENSL
jgi:hypothetical protein